MLLSTQAPFLTERGITNFGLAIAEFGLETNPQSEIRILQSLDSPISHNHLLSTLVPARLIAACWLSPGRYRISSAGRFAFASAMRMVYWIHGHTAHMRSDASPTCTSRFTQRNVLVLNVTDLAHRRSAFNRNSAHFTGRHTQLRVVAFLGQQLRERASRPRHLSAFARTQFDVVNLRAQRNVPN